MTIEEFNAIKWELVAHLSVLGTHYSIYEGEYKGITITMQIEKRVFKNGSIGKTRTCYAAGLKKFKSKKELIKYLDSNEKD